jgi:hypothetical protein
MFVVDRSMLREPNLLIPGKKPIGPVKIDWSNPLSIGLIEYYLCNSYRSLFGRNLTPATSSNYEVRAINGDQYIWQSNSQATATLDSFISASSPITILIKFINIQSFGNDNRHFINSSSSSIICRSTNSSAYEFLVNSLTNDRISHSFAFTAGESFVGGGSWGGTGTYLRVITSTESDGTKITQNGSASTGTYSSATHTINVNGGSMDGLVWISCWNRQLSEVEVNEFIADPYQFLIPA